MIRYFKEITEAEKQELLDEIQTIILDNGISYGEFIDLLEEKGYLLYPLEITLGTKSTKYFS